MKCAHSTCQDWFITKRQIKTKTEHLSTQTDTILGKADELVTHQGGTNVFREAGGEQNNGVWSAVTHLLATTIRTEVWSRASNLRTDDSSADWSTRLQRLILFGEGHASERSPSRQEAITEFRSRSTTQPVATKLPIFTLKPRQRNLNKFCLVSAPSTGGAQLAAATVDRCPGRQQLVCSFGLFNKSRRAKKKKIKEKPN